MVVCHGIPWYTPVPDTLQKEDRRASWSVRSNRAHWCRTLVFLCVFALVIPPKLGTWPWNNTGLHRKRDLTKWVYSQKKNGWLPHVATHPNSPSVLQRASLKVMSASKQICQGTWKPSTCWQLNHVPLWWLHCPSFLWPGMAHTQLSVRLETTKVNKFMIFSWMLQAATIKLLLFLAALWLLLLSPMPGLHFSKATSTGPVSQQ